MVDALQREDGAERIPIGLVTGNYFEVMGLSAILGRSLVLVTTDRAYRRSRCSRTKAG
jgi:hypothetical protein